MGNCIEPPITRIDEYYTAQINHKLVVHKLNDCPYKDNDAVHCWFTEVNLITRARIRHYYNKEQNNLFAVWDYYKFYSPYTKLGYYVILSPEIILTEDHTITYMLPTGYYNVYKFKKIWSPSNTEQINYVCERDERPPHRLFPTGHQEFTRRELNKLLEPRIIQNTPFDFFELNDSSVQPWLERVNKQEVSLNFNPTLFDIRNELSVVPINISLDNFKKNSQSNNGN